MKVKFFPKYWGNLTPNKWAYFWFLVNPESAMSQHYTLFPDQNAHFGLFSFMFALLLNTASKYLLMAHPEWLSGRCCNTYSKKEFKQCIWFCSFLNSSFFSLWLSNCIQSIVHRQPPLWETGTFLIIVLDFLFNPLPPSPPTTAILRVEFPGWVCGMYCFEMVCMSVLAA